MKVLTTALILGILTGCTTTATTPNDADAYIRAELPRFSDAFNRGDWATLGGYYTEDAVLLAPHADVARGPVAVRQAFASFAPMRPRMTLSTDRIVQSCDTAYEYGTYQMQLTPPGQSMITDRGKYLTVWRRGADGRWKIAADAFNTSMPGPGM